MKRFFGATILLVVLAGPPQQAFAMPSDNAVMKALFAEDQRVRQSNQPGDWGDTPRRDKTRALLQSGVLKTGRDFEEAAFIFQHGEQPDDYLLAHVLAMIAVAKGEKNALWIASATLDRYLQSIGRKQVLGTQFQLPFKHGKIDPAGLWTQEPYDRALISDALRQELGVPSQKQQQAQIKQVRAGMAASAKTR